jgi:hypothetical protein
VTTHSRAFHAPEIEKFTGGNRALMLGGVAAVVGLGLTAVGAFFNAKSAGYSYLVAFMYWLGISLGALILLSCFNAANARWIVVIRRPMEIMAIAVPIFVVLFIPIAVGVKAIFPWTDVPGMKLGHEAAHLMHHKHVYLSVPFFLIRAVIYFAVWIAVSHVLHRWSTRQDVDGGNVLTFKQRVFSAYALPFLALSITFAAFDWIMSLDPLWGSTIFGVYYFAGSFLGGIAVLTIATVLSRGNKQHFGELVTGDHLHNLGKLLLAFTAFWAYIGFSQYLLIWIANLPEETPWYIIRTRTGWSAVFAFLIIGHFALPFILLLSRKLKLRRGFLLGMSCWLLFAHAVDVYWMVMPVLNPETPQLHWTFLTAFVGVGGAAVAFAIFRARGGYLVPVKDPFLADSLRYTQP